MTAIKKFSFRSITKTVVLTSFTIVTAFIWKDVIMEFIELLVPPGEELMFKFIAACIATVLIIILLFIIFETEYEAELVIRKIKKRK